MLLQRNFWRKQLYRSVVKLHINKWGELAILESVAGKHERAGMVKALKEELGACCAKIKKLSDEITVLQQHVCDSMDSQL